MLQLIATVANVRGMEATEVAVIVAVSTRLVTDNQGIITSDVFRAVNELVDLCHGARSQNQHMVEARRRGLEFEARAHAGPVVLAGPLVQLSLNAAGHVFLAEWGLHLADEGDSKDDGSVGSGWGRERPPLGPDSVLLTDNEVQTQRDDNSQ